MLDAPAQTPMRLCDTSGEAFIADIATRLEDPENAPEDGEHSSSEDGATARPARVIHLRPPECPNTMSTMKALVTAFISEPPGGIEGA